MVDKFILNYYNDYSGYFLLFKKPRFKDEATFEARQKGYRICENIGDEKDDYKATVLNVKHGVSRIRQAFKEHPEIESDELEIVGAVYNVDTGKVDWI